VVQVGQKSPGNRAAEGLEDAFGADHVACDAIFFEGEPVLVDGGLELPGLLRPRRPPFLDARHRQQVAGQLVLLFRLHVQSRRVVRSLPLVKRCVGFERERLVGEVSILRRRIKRLIQILLGGR
jgi:hypothetical protein